MRALTACVRSPRIRRSTFCLSLSRRRAASRCSDTASTHPTIARAASRNLRRAPKRRSRRRSSPSAAKLFHARSSEPRPTRPAILSARLRASFKSSHVLNAASALLWSTRLPNLDSAEMSAASTAGAVEGEAAVRMGRGRRQRRQRRQRRRQQRGGGGSAEVAAAAEMGVAPGMAHGAAHLWGKGGDGAVVGARMQPLLLIGHGSWRSAPERFSRRSTQHSHAFESARWTIRRAKRPSLLLPVLSRESTHAFNARASPLARSRFVRLRSRSFSSRKPRHRLKALCGPRVTMRDTIALASRSPSSTCGEGRAPW